MSFSIVSHLLTTIIIPLPVSCANPAIRLSYSRIPSSALITIRTTSERSMARIERITEYFSVFSYTLPDLRIPAVSIIVYSCPWLSTKLVSIASRVVPATGLAITRSSPRMALIKLDFPTFGRPIKLKRIISGFSFSSSTGRFSTIASNISPVPIP
ncbi:hypothetical protein SAM_1579 [Streptococcus agalactiae CJB111]|nr:hypothetical protein SAM_1579 [Streptococcus agalactiae CJB111]